MRARIVFFFTVSLVAVTACTPPLAVDPAIHAADPRCASIMLAIPESVGGLAMRDTTSQATAAYGSDNSIVVRCGVTPPGPSVDPCVTVSSSRGDVDWITRDVEDFRVAVSYGRDPAVEVFVPLIRADQAAVEILAAFSPAAALAEANGRACLGPTDTP